jgi:myosin-5
MQVFSAAIDPIFLHWLILHEFCCSCIYVSLINIFLKGMASCVFQYHDSNEDLAYWLSNSSTLLIILQKSLRAVGSTGTTPQKRPQTQSSFLGRMVCSIAYSRSCRSIIWD